MTSKQGPQFLISSPFMSRFPKTPAKSRIQETVQSGASPECQAAALALEPSKFCLQLIVPSSPISASFSEARIFDKREDLLPFGATVYVDKRAVFHTQPVSRLVFFVKFEEHPVATSKKE